MNKECIEDGCGSPPVKRKMCNAHYLRWVRSTPPAERAPRYRPADLERFYTFVNKMGPVAANRPDLGRCHIWGGGDCREYGIFWAGGKSHRAHVWIYKKMVGPIPDGKPLDHFACDRTLCVNWRHVRPETHRVNILRSRNRAAVNAVKEKCPDGHDYDEVNTRINGDGARECLKCRRKQQRELKQATRAVARGYVPLAPGTPTCPLGHDLTSGDGRQFRDGTLVCLICTMPAPNRRGGRPQKAAA